MSNVFNGICDIINKPIVQIDKMYPLNKIENAWKAHQDSSCPCPFYYALPCSWKIYNVLDKNGKAKQVQVCSVHI